MKKKTPKKKITKKNIQKPVEINGDNLTLTFVEDQMRESYLDYAMSVIVGRALPDVRDGLKPVHRRILYSMHEMNLTSDRPYKKCATVVGDVLGKYHPHGDNAVYDTLVRLAQDFSMRYPLIDGQGNFGSIDGDNAAAYRYTESRLDKITNYLLDDIHKETVDFTPNFDGSKEEPVVLPSALPHLLANGSEGIAVGMATKIPPHNLAELCDALIAYINNPAITLAALMKHVHGPDFPTGAKIFGRNGIVDAYKTGRGKITIGATATIENLDNRTAIAISEIPYQTNKATLQIRIAELVNDKKIVGISNIRDESDRSGIRVVIELKRDANPQVILNKLFKHTQMKITFGIIMLAIVDGKPRELGLKEIFECFVAHRKEIITRRTRYELRKAKERAHILEGFRKALSIIDAVIKTIRSSKDRPDAHKRLVKKFKFTDIQAGAILDLRLHRLTSLEIKQVVDELKDLKTRIKRFEQILKSGKEVLKIMQNDLIEIKEKYPEPRRTEIMDEMKEYKPEDLIKKEEVVITISHRGYIKRQPVSGYRSQARGGRGLTGGTSSRDEDFMEHLFTASTHDYLLFFSSAGKCYWLKVYDVPAGSRTARGKSIMNCIGISQQEKIKAIISVSGFSEDRWLAMASRKGMIKKTPLSDFSNPRTAGVIAITIKPGDELIEVTETDGDNHIILGTAGGRAIHFHETEVRSMGRSAAGVRGIKLKKDDYVIGMVAVREQTKLLSVAEKGYGKLTPVKEYTPKHRGGQGIIAMKITSRIGKMVALKEISKKDDLMLVTHSGIIIRVPAKKISIQGRSTQGVRLIKLDKTDRVVDVARIKEDSSESE